MRYIDAALSNRSGTGLPRTVVTYARNPWGSSATTLPFGDVHPGNKPSALSTETVPELCKYTRYMYNDDPLWRTRPRKLTHSQRGGAGGFVNGARHSSIARSDHPSAPPQPTSAPPYDVRERCGAC